MTAKANPSIIGMFVLSALALGILAIFYLGDAGLNEEKPRLILFFEGDVKGLDVGSPVTLRGVRIGQVEDIAVVFDSKDLSFDIPVIISVTRSKLGFEEGMAREKDGALLDRLIEQGLRARLNIQSLVTGKLEVELGFHPNSEAKRRGLSSEYPEIPTIPSNMEKIARVLEDLPLERIARRTEEILAGIDKIVNDPDLPEMLAHLASAIKRFDSLARKLETSAPELTRRSVIMIDETRNLVEQLQTQLEPLIGEWTRVARDSRTVIARMDKKVDHAVESWDETLLSGEQAFSQFSKTLSSAESVVAEDSPVMRDVGVALRELAAATRSIRIMAEYLERHPEALIRGKQ
ncbi:MAG: MCE family protein [gamma proteobacterium endosymbiont of Lamellibrachia anaximandri]|nr:MCE family protein [gamma proteobacterium endosymbiont of Lamellibrachia anaximandri]MBL3532868.1 MCE family protein [gamma proteobacterium endosymbiont of Lamellibrachia anaximandri]